ncbi:LuxR C-terminal-related transcriptional regulator [Actinomyces wuliandei]|uniref:LuxR C-terminal-related transcriptional regulator n=1 Tax=Actinomyces wuliandei TaxID=2057743 RepID=UPI000FDCBFA1|nr:response regulator transcription factor [Actinomyces wuliandei]
MTGEEAASPLRVLVVGAASVTRRALEAGLGGGPRFDVVGCTDDGSRALGFLAERAVDLVILDWDSTDLGASALLKRLRYSDHGGRVAVMTAYRGEGVLQGAVEAGVVAFVDKNEGWSPRLGDQLLRAAEGQVVLSDWPGDLLEALVQHPRDREDGSDGEAGGSSDTGGSDTGGHGSGDAGSGGGDVSSTATGIPSRLVPVYQGILDGLTNREIARRTGLSEGTVRIYVSELLTLLECQSRTEVVSHALGTSGP